MGNAQTRRMARGGGGGHGGHGDNARGDETMGGMGGVQAEAIPIPPNLTYGCVWQKKNTPRGSGGGVCHTTTHVFRMPFASPLVVCSFPPLLLCARVLPRELCARDTGLNVEVVRGLLRRLRVGVVLVWGAKGRASTSNFVVYPTGLPCIYFFVASTRFSAHPS